jgi:hypothetical protein
MVIMIVSARSYGVLLLAALGWAARSIRWRVMVVARLHGASVLALTVQEFWTRVYADLSGSLLSKVTAMASYTDGLFIEIVCSPRSVVGDGATRIWSWPARPSFPDSGSWSNCCGSPMTPTRPVMMPQPPSFTGVEVIRRHAGT